MSEQPLRRDEVRLDGGIQVDIGPQIATVLDVARRAREAVCCEGPLSVLHGKPRGERGDVIGADESFIAEYAACGLRFPGPRESTIDRLSRSHDAPGDFGVQDRPDASTSVVSLGYSAHD